MMIIDNKYSIFYNYQLSPYMLIISYHVIVSHLYHLHLPSNYNLQFLVYFSLKLIKKFVTLIFSLLIKLKIIIHIY